MKCFIGTACRCSAKPELCSEPSPSLRQIQKLRRRRNEISIRTDNDTSCGNCIFSIYIYIHICVYICTCIYIHTNIHIYMYVYTYIHVRICIFGCNIYIYVHVPPSSCQAASFLAVSSLLVFTAYFLMFPKLGNVDEKPTIWDHSYHVYTYVYTHMYIYIHTYIYSMYMYTYVYI